MNKYFVLIETDIINMIFKDCSNKLSVDINPILEKRIVNIGEKISEEESDSSSDEEQVCNIDNYYGNGMGVVIGYTKDDRLAILMEEKFGIRYIENERCKDIKYEDKLYFISGFNIKIPISITSETGQIYHDQMGYKIGIIIGETEGGLAVLFQNKGYLKEVERNKFKDNICHIFHSKKYSDYTIIHKDMQYPAHKYVLVTNSEYYATKFNGKWNEKDDKLPDVDNKILEIVLEYMYFHNFNKNISLDKLIQIKILAYFLQIEDLILIVNKYISKIKINEKNFDIFFDNSELCIDKENEIISIIKKSNDAYDYLSKNNPELKERIMRHMLGKKIEYR